MKLVQSQADRGPRARPSDNGPFRVTAVYSPTGGSGKTTIAVNLAAELARRLPGECLLLDLGLPYNHAALAANVVPTGCVAIADARDDRALYATLMRSIARHRSGLFLLPATQRLEHSELITPDLVQRAANVLLGAFSELVVDLGVGLSETALRVLESADRIVLVVTPELASIKDTAELLELFSSVLMIGMERVQLTLNRPRPDSVISTADVERALGRSLETVLAFEGARLDRAAVTGQLMLHAEPHSSFSRGIRALADRYFGTVEEEQTKVARM